MCACKGNTTTSRQVTSVKQIVKKPAQTYSNGTRRGSRTQKRQIVFKSHM